MSDNKDALMKALSVERQTSPWWTDRTVPTTPNFDYTDTELACARRRRALAKACEGYSEHEEEVQ